VARVTGTAAASSADDTTAPFRPPFPNSFRGGAPVVASTITQSGVRSGPERLR
jgi:hypothetical protein